jgi:hypothetical protein
MPLSRQEFDAGGESLGKLLRLLRDHPDQAFIFSELLEALQVDGVDIDELDFLLKLAIESDQIEAKLIGVRVYYASLRSIGFRG